MASSQSLASHLATPAPPATPAPREGSVSAARASNSVLWSFDQERALLEALEAADKAGERAHQGWKPQVWENAMRAVNMAGTKQFTVQKVKSKMDQFKKAWKDWKQHIQNTSGWAVDEDLQAPYTDRHIEDDYYSAHKERRKFRVKVTAAGVKSGGINHRELLEVVVGEVVATGENALTISQLIEEGPPNDEDEADIDDSTTESEDIVMSTERTPSRTPTPARSQTTASTPGLESSLRMRVAKRAATEVARGRLKKPAKSVEIANSILEMAEGARVLAQAIAKAAEEKPEKPSAIQRALQLLESNSQYQAMGTRERLEVYRALLVRNHASDLLNCPAELRDSWLLEVLDEYRLFQFDPSKINESSVHSSGVDVDRSEFNT